jgi:hypothetical protein
MSLVDDGLVVTDKIGTSNYFWSYPSAAIQTVSLDIMHTIALLILWQKRNKLSDLQHKVDKETERKERLQKQIDQAKQDREETKERELLLLQLKELGKQSKELNAELQKYKENDPTLYRKKGNRSYNQLLSNSLIILYRKCCSSR